ncbi:MAG: homoserine O-acetyltransferase/O-succinyltransferase family protein [Bacteroidales bacterium]
MGIKLRIGLLNIMPEAEKYETKILSMITQQSNTVEIVLIKSSFHSYKSTDKHHLDKFYCTFGQAIANKKLDGLIVTGAPVELMPFENITYWNELIEIFNYAQKNIISTLGICWGGIAIGKFLGINEIILDKKLFGVFPSTYHQEKHWINNSSKSVFDCPQSRYASLNEKELELAENNGSIQLLVDSTEAGHFIFESSDERFVAHLGHPEYDIQRILSEYERDQIKGLNLIPQHFDVKNPVNTWQENSLAFFGKWLEMINNKSNSFQFVI